MMTIEQVAALVWRLVGIFLMFGSVPSLYALFTQFIHNPRMSGLVAIAPMVGFWAYFWPFFSLLLGFMLVWYAKQIGQVTCKGL